MLPTFRLAIAGVISTDAVGVVLTVTVMLDVPLFPSQVALIVAVPPPSPLTRPVDDTVATEGALVAHVKLRPGSNSPSASSAVAVSCTFPPTITLADVGTTLTVTTGATGPP